MSFADSTTWLMVGCYGAAVTSALLPWVNAEVLMLSAMPVAAAHGALMPLVAVFTLGQMTGKSIMFWLSRSARLPVPRMRDAVEAWRGRFERHPRSALACVFVSAALGFPPFYAVSVAAGTFRMAFGKFLAVGSAGRFVHFAALALLLNSQLPPTKHQPPTTNKVSVAGISLPVADPEPRTPNPEPRIPDPGSLIPDPGSRVVEQFLRPATPALISYRALRHLEASTRGGKMRAELDALTVLDADGRFRYEVIQASGSDLIRSRVLVAALDAEARSRNEHDTDSAALTPANYDFRVEAGPEPGLLTLMLTPRRRSHLLIDGRATLTEADTDLLRVEGRLSKSPSFWTRRVDIVRTYGRIDGVRVPVEMTSLAAVRVVGASSFSMTYRYEVINGRLVVGG